jgi:hypothetical protein
VAVDEPARRIGLQERAAGRESIGIGRSQVRPAGPDHHEIRIGDGRGVHLQGRTPDRCILAGRDLDEAGRVERERLDRELPRGATVGVEVPRRVDVRARMGEQMKRRRVVRVATIDRVDELDGGCGRVAGPDGSVEPERVGQDEEARAHDETASGADRIARAVTPRSG